MCADPTIVKLVNVEAKRINKLLSNMEVIALDSVDMKGDPIIKIPTFSTHLNGVPSLASSILGGYGHVFHAKNMEEGGQQKTALSYLDSMIQHLPFIGDKEGSVVDSQRSDIKNKIGRFN